MGLGVFLGVSDLEEFVETYVDSFVAWDVLTLFGTSPNRHSNPTDIAQLVGRPQAMVDACLSSLAEKGFFLAEDSGGKTFYHWKPNADLARKVDGFVKATADRRGRLRALSILLRKVGGTASGNPL